jgi:hypothetical protein
VFDLDAIGRALEELTGWNADDDSIAPGATRGFEDARRRMVNGYAFVDSLLATGGDPFAYGGSHLLLELNHVVLSGTTPARRAEFAGHIAATERRFYEDHACGADSFYDDAAYLAKMNALANVIDELFNGEGHARGRKVGFVQMVFPFGEGPGRANYISNAVRADVVALLKEQLGSRARRTRKGAHDEEASCDSDRGHVCFDPRDRAAWPGAGMVGGPDRRGRFPGRRVVQFGPRLHRTQLCRLWRERSAGRAGLSGRDLLSSPAVRLLLRLPSSPLQGRVMRMVEFMGDRRAMSRVLSSTPSSSSSSRT